MEATAQRWQRRTARLEFVLEYIDAHHGEPLDIEFLSGLASISPFHFHRLFSAHIGESVSAYVRRRTLERAARRLLLEGASVTACGSMAGYASSSAFARAFRKQFGMSPRRFGERLRERASVYAACLPAGPHYRRVPAMEVVAIRRFGRPEQARRAAWDALYQYLRDAALEPAQCVRIGVPTDCCDSTPAARHRYEACALVDVPATGEVFAKRIAAGDYAVFDYRGPADGLQAAHEAVLWGWYPRSGVGLREAPAFHWVADPLGSADLTADVVAEIMLPVERPGALSTVPGATLPGRANGLYADAGGRSLFRPSPCR